MNSNVDILKRELRIPSTEDVCRRRRHIDAEQAKRYQDSIAILRINQWTIRYIKPINSREFYHLVELVVDLAACPYPSDMSELCEVYRQCRRRWREQRRQKREIAKNKRDLTIFERAALWQPIPTETYLWVKFCGKDKWQHHEEVRKQTEQVLRRHYPSLMQFAPKKHWSHDTSLRMDAITRTRLDFIQSITSKSSASSSEVNSVSYRSQPVESSSSSSSTATGSKSSSSSSSSETP